MTHAVLRGTSGDAAGYCVAWIGDRADLYDSVSGCLIVFVPEEKVGSPGRLKPVKTLSCHVTPSQQQSLQG